MSGQLVPGGARDTPLRRATRRDRELLPTTSTSAAAGAAPLPRGLASSRSSPGGNGPSPLHASKPEPPPKPHTAARRRRCTCPQPRTHSPEGGSRAPIRPVGPAPAAGKAAVQPWTPPLTSPTRRAPPSSCRPWRLLPPLTHRTWGRRGGAAGSGKRGAAGRCGEPRHSEEGRGARSFPRPSALSRHSAQGPLR